MTASLKVRIREEAEGALRRDATRAALGAGFGAAFGLPRGASDDAAGAGPELAGGGGATEEDETFGGAMEEDEGFGGSILEEDTGGAGGIALVVAAVMIELADCTTLTLLLVSHSGCHLPFCATGVA